MAKTWRVPEGEVLIHEGDSSAALFYVKKGLFGVYKQRGGKEVVIGQIQSGEIVGEMSFFEEINRCATVRALTECEVLEIPTKSFRRYFSTRPEWHQRMIQTLLRRIRNVNLKLQGD